MGFSNPFFFSTALALMALTTISCSMGDTKLKQYMVEGEGLYLKHCSNCHQVNGQGLAALYPPLNPSDYIDQHIEDVVCLIKYGKKGKMTVNGKVYDQPMPALALSDLEVAEIVTYLYNSGGRNKGLVDVGTTSTMLKKCTP